MTRILAVEDSSTQSEALRLILEGAGFTATMASDGETALALFEREGFDLVVSDIVMPGMSGYELCQKIKLTPRGRNVPVMLLSSLNDPMDIIKGLECEADNFITKPYEADRLIARIRSVLLNRDARSSSAVKIGVELLFLGRKFVISAGKEQILDLLISTFEDTVRTNLGLQETQANLEIAKAKVEGYARDLEVRVQERTAELEQKARQLNVALEETRKSETRFRSLFSKSAAPMCVLDIETLRFLLVNDAAVRDYGYSQAEFLKMTMRDVLIEEQHPLIESGVQALLSLRQPRLQRRHRKKSGDLVDVEMVGTPLDYQGQPAVLLVINDVTDRLKAESQLRHTERLNAVGSVTGGIAHDFNNLLAVIRANAEDLCEQVQDQGLREEAEMVLEAANRGAELIARLMAFARKQELAPKNVDVNILVDSTMKLIRPALPTNIAIKVQKADQLPMVSIDAARLENALLNLAVNSRDAMPDGGEIVIETKISDLDEGYAAENPEVRTGPHILIAVSDTGGGMPQDVIDHAFEPFFTTKGVGKGTGLGLSMVYGFVKQSGGHAKIYSEVGRGTTIKIYLPAMREDAPEQPKLTAKKAPAETKGSGEILLVEDDDLVRKSVAAKLTRLGYAVTAVSAAAAAVTVLESGAQFKLVLSDVIMPGAMTGADLAREIQKRWPRTSVLLTSGYTESAISGKVTLPPGVRLLSKPYSNADLAQAIQETYKRIYE